MIIFCTLQFSNIFRNVFFYYSSGVSMGMLLSILLLVFIVSKLIPKVRLYFNCPFYLCAELCAQLQGIWTENFNGSFKRSLKTVMLLPLHIFVSWLLEIVVSFFVVQTTLRPAYLKIYMFVLNRITCNYFCLCIRSKYVKYNGRQLPFRSIYLTYPHFFHESLSWLMFDKQSMFLQNRTKPFLLITRNSVLIYT